MFKCLTKCFKCLILKYLIQLKNSNFFNTSTTSSFAVLHRDGVSSCVELGIFSLCLPRVLFMYSGFLPESKNAHARFIGDSKLAIGVSFCVMERLPIQGLLCFLFTDRLFSSSHTTLNWITHNDGYLLRIHCEHLNILYILL